MWELFVFGSLFFWLLCAAEVVLLFYSVEKENGWLATGSLIAYGACLQFLGDINIIEFLRVHPIISVGIFGAYFVFGTIVGIGKWWLFIGDIQEDYDEKKARWLVVRGRHNEKNIPPDLQADWKESLKSYCPEFLRSTGGYSYDKPVFSYPPKVREHKARILRWMSFWPVSLLWSLFDDVVRRLFKRAYRVVADYLQGIADRLTASSKADFSDDPPL